MEDGRYDRSLRRIFSARASRRHMAAAAFLRLARQFGQPSDGASAADGIEGGVKLPLALTHEDLADLTGSSRVTITRILGELRSDGALEGTRGVYVANLEGLERATDHYVMQVL